MAIQYTVDGKPATRKQAIAAWVARDDFNAVVAVEHFQQAEQQSTAGYVARDAVEAAGVTIRHANEEQA